MRKFCGKGIFREIWKNRYVVLKGDRSALHLGEGGRLGVVFLSLPPFLPLHMKRALSTGPPPRPPPCTGGGEGTGTGSPAGVRQPPGLPLLLSRSSVKQGNPGTPWNCAPAAAGLPVGFLWDLTGCDSQQRPGCPRTAVPLPFSRHASIRKGPPGRSAPPSSPS